MMIHNILSTQTLVSITGLIPRHASAGYYMFVAFVSYGIFTFWVLYLYRNISRSRRELQRTKESLKECSILDVLTGAYNQRYFLKRIRESLIYAQRENIKFSLLKLDIELFENVNRIYGIPFGDRILQEFHNFIKGIVRNSDIVCRFSDDCFGILLNFADKENALALASRIQDMLKFKSFGGKNITLYASIGLVTFPDDSTSEIGLLSLLDRCIDKSKSNGIRVVNPDELIEEQSDKRGNYVYTVNELKQRVVELEGALGKTIIESIIAFAHAIKAKDSYTVEHTKKTVRIALSIGKKLDLNQHRLDILRYAAFLHDLGKVGIPERILTKPGKLTKEEFEEIKKHPVIGAEILRPLHELKDMVPLILYHHERIDGKGYPYGLKAGNIPLGARIISVADVFQALISDRVYRKAYSFNDAMMIMEEERGTHFDAHIIDIFKGIAAGIYER